MYNLYNPTKWRDGSEYGASSFNNFESGIKNLENYAKYREKQALNLGKAMKKLRYNGKLKISMRGDSVLFGYNTITGGEEGNRRYPNEVVADQNLSESAQADGYDGVFFYGKHPLKKLATAEGSYRASIEQKANGTPERTEVQIPDVMIQCLREVYGATNIEYVDKVYTGDCAISSFYRYTEEDDADIEICNLGINDALAAFWGTEYVGNVDEFFYWYCRLIERAIDSGTAWVILTPVLQSVTDSHDMSARATVDVYSKILYDIAKLYGCPILNGDEFSHNFNNRLIIDFTHFTCAGNETVGKRLCTPFIAGDFSCTPSPVYSGSMIGVRPQEDSINVFGNACVEFSDKAPSFPIGLDNNDLYDTGVVRLNKGLAVYMNYPLDGTVKAIYDKSVLDEKSVDELKTILTAFGGETESNDKDVMIEEILAKQDEYIYGEATNDNVLFRQADLYARAKKRGTEAYKTDYNTRIAFLQGKHGYANREQGKVTWAFYADRDGTVVIPSMYADEEATVTMHLDFDYLVPEKAGRFLTYGNNPSTKALWTVSELTALANKLGVDVNGLTTKEQIAREIKTAKYSKPQYEQSSPSDIFDWTDSDEIDYTFVEPCECEITFDGYYNKRKVTSESPVIKVVSKGWHTITLTSTDKFLAFGLQFMSIEDYKRHIQ